VTDEPWHGWARGSRAADIGGGESLRRASTGVKKVPLDVADGTRLHELKDKFPVVREDRLSDGVCLGYGVAGPSTSPSRTSKRFNSSTPSFTRGTPRMKRPAHSGRVERVCLLARLRDEMQMGLAAVSRRPRSAFLRDVDETLYPGGADVPFFQNTRFFS
jgi:hypothetical protein